jgi:hypothetical protein
VDPVPEVPQGVVAGHHVFGPVVVEAVADGGDGVVPDGRILGLPDLDAVTAVGQSGYLLAADDRVVHDAGVADAVQPDAEGYLRDAAVTYRDVTGVDQDRRVVLGGAVPAVADPQAADCDAASLDGEDVALAVAVEQGRPRALPDDSHVRGPDDDCLVEPTCYAHGRSGLSRIDGLLEAVVGLAVDGRRAVCLGHTERIVVRHLRVEREVVVGPLGSTDACGRDD